MTTYYPHPALKPLKAYDRDVRGRIGIERRICRKLIKALHAAGYALRVHSGDEWETERGAKEEVLMRALFNLDNAWLHVTTKSGGKVGWVYLVFGNDGWDVISDYTTNLEETLKPINAYADELSK